MGVNTQEAAVTEPAWARLEPHRPVEPGDDRYIPRPAQGGAEIARWILAGGDTVLVVGPVGVGKSSELAAAYDSLKAHRAAAWVPVDRLANVRALTTSELVGHLTACLAAHATTLEIPLSSVLKENLRLRDRWAVADPWEYTASIPRMEGADLLVALVREVARAHASGRVSFVIDGLEKLPEGSAGVLAALQAIPSEADIVATIPWHAAWSPGGEDLVRAGERVHSILPIRLVDLRSMRVLSDPGRVASFWEKLARSRLGELSTEGMQFRMRASLWSGGIPRIYLQLLADAGTYSRLHGEPPFSRASLDLAVADLRASLRRSLLQGDVEAMIRAQGTDGVELERARRVRLLARGLLLEAEDGKLVIHPLIEAAPNLNAKP